MRGGRIGLVTQSGHQGRPIVQGTEFGVAFSRWVPTGNELDLEAADFIEYFAHDDETAVIAGYFEGFKDPPKLRRALEAANSARKPVVALKVGSTEAGYPDGVLAHRASRGLRRRGERTVPAVRSRASPRSRRASRDGRTVREAPGRNRSERLSVFDLGRLRSFDGRGGRVPRRSCPGSRAEDPTGSAVDDPGLPHRREPRRQRGAIPRHQPR